MGLLILVCAWLLTAKAQAEELKRPSVLIAMRHSDFKEKLINKIKEYCLNRSDLKVVDISALNDIDAEAYDALIVLGERKGLLMFSVKERHFLKHFEDKAKLIMVMTAASDSWEWDRDDVDVITGASRPENLETIFAEVTKRLDALLSKKVQ
jgi:putative intracellular protease/amidase